MGQITGWLLSERRKRREICLVNRVDELFWIKKHAVLFFTGVMVARQKGDKLKYTQSEVCKAEEPQHERGCWGQGNSKYSLNKRCSLG